VESSLENVTVPERGAVAVFAANSTVAWSPLAPVVGVTVSQDSSDEAVQSAPRVWTVTEVVAASAAGAHWVDDRLTTGAVAVIV
jgi:hypothetical protein